MNVILNIENAPKVESGDYIVARLVDGKAWYYGRYETYERAEEVVKSLLNAFVVEVL